MNKEHAIRTFALENAVKHEGKCMPGSIVGKIINAYPDWKGQMRDIMPLIQKVVNDVNKLTIFEQTEALKEVAPELLEKKVKEKTDDLKPLPNVKMGNVVMRMAPSPSGTLHIGHAIGLLLNSEYCKKYDGKLILRIEDTNPENIRPEAYELIPEDANWITENNVAEVVVQSDRMEIYYEHASHLIQKGHAYTCDCGPEEYDSLRKKCMPCPCREKSPKQHMERWHRMLADAPEGSMVLRLKTDIRHKNPALRDFALFRINESEHPRQGKKYRVWPLMNYAVVIDDHDLGLTHVLRGKDHVDNTKKQVYIYEYLGWTPPEFIHYGRINFDGLNLSASETAKAIQEGKYEGWGDIRLPFLQALKKRGYCPRAFQKWVRSLGLTLVDKRVEAHEFFKSLNFYNKEIVDPVSNRYFFVVNPKEVVIEGAPKQKLELDLHPENKKGGRLLKTSDCFYLAAKDFDAIESGTSYRLMDCLNFRKKNTTFVFDSVEYEKWPRQKGTILHWLSAEEDNVPVKLVLEDGTVQIGLAEPALALVNEGQTVQFERVCFATCVGIDGEHKVFWELHR